MWQAMGAFTWAFHDYTDMYNIMSNFDSPTWRPADDFLDPLSYGDRLAKIPKLVIVSSDDEFMMFEWTSRYWDRLTGEKYMLIAPNTEHSLFTGLPYVINSCAWLMKRILDE